MWYGCDEWLHKNINNQPHQIRRTEYLGYGRKHPPLTFNYLANSLIAMFPKLLVAIKATVNAGYRIAFNVL